MKYELYERPLDTVPEKIFSLDSLDYLYLIYILHLSDIFGFESHCILRHRITLKIFTIFHQAK